MAANSSHAGIGDFQPVALRRIGILVNQADSSKKRDKPGLFDQDIGTDAIVFPVQLAAETLREGIGLPFDALLRDDLPKRVALAIAAA